MVTTIIEKHIETPSKDPLNSTPGKVDVCILSQCIPTLSSPTISATRGEEPRSPAGGVAPCAAQALQTSPHTARHVHRIGAFEFP